MMTNPTPAVGTNAHATTLTLKRHPDVKTALAWLTYSHLPANLQSLSEPFYQAAWILLQRVPTDSAELTTALNSLVEAKDWAVRAGIRSDYGRPGSVARPTEVVDPPVAAVVDPAGDPYATGVAPDRLPG